MNSNIHLCDLSMSIFGARGEKIDALFEKKNRLRRFRGEELLFFIEMKMYIRIEREREPRTRVRSYKLCIGGNDDERERVL